MAFSDAGAGKEIAETPGVIALRLNQKRLALDMAEVVQRGGEELVLLCIGFETEDLAHKAQWKRRLISNSSLVGLLSSRSECISLRAKLLNHFADATDSWGVWPDYSGGFQKFISTRPPVTHRGYTNPLQSSIPEWHPRRRWFCISNSPQNCHR